MQYLQMLQLVNSVNKHKHIKEIYSLQSKQKMMLKIIDNELSQFAKFMTCLLSKS